MCAMEKVTSCQISFLPVGSIDYLEKIQQVLDIIKKSGLEHNVGVMSTTVRGERSKLFKLIEDIYENMDDICSFALDVRISNLCGCGCKKQ